MGILNITPDSFFDGNLYLSCDNAVKHALAMVVEGADIVDVGGESTRPSKDTQFISLQEELDRVIPVIEKLKQELAVPISIDTYKPEVMREAIKAGASIVNDTRALTQPGSLEVVKENNVTVCLMHMQGTSQAMQDNPVYNNVVTDIFAFLNERVDTAVKAGIAKEKIIIDPGFGFGKTVEHNLELLRNLKEFQKIGCAVLAGWSRKTSIGKILNRPPQERLYGSIAAAVIAAINGANIIRVHDVRATVEALKFTTAVYN